MKTNRHIKVGEMEVPPTYWDMTEEEQDQICLKLMETMLNILDKNLNKEVSRIDVLNNLLDTSIIVNEQNEEYEICEVMVKIRKLIHE